MGFRSFIVAVCLALPGGWVVEAPYAPGPRYSGHWGVDFAVAEGSAVPAPVAGEVTFAGTVAGMRTVTITTSDGARVSLSHLGRVVVAAGDLVSVGDVVGRSGRAHGREAVHLSVRVNGRYVDPDAYLRCRDGVIRLLPTR